MDDFGDDELDDKYTLFDEDEDDGIGDLLGGDEDKE